MGWTKEQQSVIDTRNKNMLVSAAAGSGKTAVLVERIISRILDVNDPVDVDKILVVTFTNAAAGEMKERVRKAIDKAVLESPGRTAIRRQATLIHNAQIRTIDSFCSWVVKNYFYEIDQDPAFRIGTTGELKMMKDEVLSQVISDRLAAGEEDFMLLADAYIEGNRVSELKGMVYTLTEKANSFPWPSEWYDNALRIYDCDTEEALEQSEAMQVFLEAIRALFYRHSKGLEAQIRNASGQKLKDFLENERQFYIGIAEAATYSDMCAIFAAGLDYKRLTITGDDKANEDTIRAARDHAKDDYNAYKGCFSQSLTDIFADLHFVERQARALVSLTRDFDAALFTAKKRKNIYEFNDIEHMALRILRNENSAEHEKRPVAMELSAHFAEVMVDEYQDSNDLQEWILTAVARDNNYFTVGDVKQSIYAFRQASPQIFMDKFHRYAAGEENSVRIDLDCNFRSRSQVLDFSNQIFRALMHEDMGGVEYDSAAELKVGATYFKDDGTNFAPEIMVADAGAERLRSTSLKNGAQMEAQMVADRIKQLTDGSFSVMDGDHLRPARYSDIVLLMRGVSNLGDDYVSVLETNGIPAYVESEKGFFDRDEIQIILSMLQVIDNPFNDIALAAVLHSPMFDFSSQELADLRARHSEGTFYEAVFAEAQEGNNDKLAAFTELLNYFRQLAVDTPIHELITELLERTGFDLYVRALPLSSGAIANINKLVDEAISFEGTSYQGLSKFVGYINDLRTYEEEPGLAKTFGENDVAVRIMTIHKSKGLEFPIVFLCNAASKLQSDRDSMFYHRDWGLVMKYKNPVTRVSYATPLSVAIANQLKIDDLGEELRILYVALTRAKEKLIITANMKPSTKKGPVDKQLSNMNSMTDRISIDYKLREANYLSWIVAALRASGQIPNLRIVRVEDLLIAQTKQAVDREAARLFLRDRVIKAAPGAGDGLEHLMEFSYDRSLDTGYKNKYSVSEIKHQDIEEKFGFNEDAAPAFVFNEKEPYVPAFIRKKLETAPIADDTTPAGALYGTAMHRVMECFDFTVSDLAASFDEQLEYMKTSGSLPADEAARINTYKLRQFVKSDTAKRMQSAALKGGLYKEQPFVFAEMPNNLFAEDYLKPGFVKEPYEEDKMVLVQGIIDVFFEEDDGIVLLDYKTDRVDEAGQLVLRYEKQLRLYQQAISDAFDVQIKDVLIYSFCLNKTISLGV